MTFDFYRSDAVLREMAVIESLFPHSRITEILSEARDVITDMAEDLRNSMPLEDIQSERHIDWYASYDPSNGLWCETRDLTELFEQSRYYAGDGELRHYKFTSRVITTAPRKTLIQAPADAEAGKSLDPLPFVWDNPDNGPERSDTRFRHPKQNWYFSPREEFEQDINNYPKKIQEQA